MTFTHESFHLVLSKDLSHSICDLPGSILQGVFDAVTSDAVISDAGCFGNKKLSILMRPEIILSSSLLGLLI